MFEGKMKPMTLEQLDSETGSAIEDEKTIE